MTILSYIQPDKDIGVEHLSYSSCKTIAISLIRCLGLSMTDVSIRLKNKYLPSEVYVILTKNDPAEISKVREILQVVAPYGTTFESFQTVSINTGRTNVPTASLQDAT